MPRATRIPRPDCVYDRRRTSFPASGRAVNITGKKVGFFQLREMICLSSRCAAYYDRNERIGSFFLVLIRTRITTGTSGETKRKLLNGSVKAIFVRIDVR